MLKYDVYIVIGVFLMGLSLPAILGAWADRRAPLAALFTMLVAAGLIGLAISQNPGVYTLSELPHVFVRVLAATRNAIF